MKNKKDDDFADRRGAAANAKAAQLQAHRTAKEAAEPNRLARQEERLAAAAARDDRNAQRARLKLEEQERLGSEAANQAAAEATAKAAAETPEKGHEDREVRVVEDQAAKKAERDRRYANRKARQR